MECNNCKSTNDMYYLRSEYCWIYINGKRVERAVDIHFCNKCGNMQCEPINMEVNIAED